jgi:hypothetical protein
MSPAGAIGVNVALAAAAVAAQEIDPLLGRGPIAHEDLAKVLPLLLHSPLLPRVQRRLFFGAPLPPLIQRQLPGLKGADWGTACDPPLFGPPPRVTTKLLVPSSMSVASRRPRPSPILNVPTTYASGGLGPASLGCSLLADGSSVPASDRIVQTLAVQRA